MYVLLSGANLTLIVTYSIVSGDLSLKFQRDAYKDAIDKVRSAHRDSVPGAHNTMVCPRCGTKQVVNDTPGMRTCLKCSFEFRPRSQSDQGPPRR